MADLTVDRTYGSAGEITAAEQRKVVLASSLGTVFEWYDFYLYGSLAAIIGSHFFTGLTQSGQFIFALLAFAAGFFVRPFGALFFGRIGDLVGRKYTFLITILIMGLSTFTVGVLPSYNSIGVAAPIILIALRLLQGLALGGDLRGRACGAKPPRLPDELDSDHGDARPLLVADRHPALPSILAGRHSRRKGRVVFRRIRPLAHTLSCFNLSFGDLGLDQA
jgi:hypothetical protein